MNDPQINVDHFYHRPVYHVVGLLTEHAEIPAISRELESAGVDVAAEEILCGERGAAILDEHGRYHGLRARVVRAFQRLGYDEETLETYDEALRHGDLLLRVPARPADRYHIAALLQRHQVHDVGYFGPAPSSSSPSPIRADPICPGTAGRLGGWCVQDLAPCPPQARKEGHTRRFTVIHGATALLLTCATTGTRPTSPLSGPGGGRRCQQVLWSLAGRAPTARGASWTARRAGQRGARWCSTT